MVQFVHHNYIITKGATIVWLRWSLLAMIHMLGSYTIKAFYVTAPLKFAAFSSIRHFFKCISSATAVITARTKILCIRLAFLTFHTWWPNGDITEAKIRWIFKIYHGLRINNGWVGRTISKEGLAVTDRFDFNSFIVFG